MIFNLKHIAAVHGVPTKIKFNIVLLLASTLAYAIWQFSILTHYSYTRVSFIVEIVEIILNDIVSYKIANACEAAQQSS